MIVRTVCIDCDGGGFYPGGSECVSCGGSGRVEDGQGAPMSALDAAIEEHRTSCVVATVKASDLSIDGAEIRRELATADAQLKAAILAMLPPRR